MSENIKEYVLMLLRSYHVDNQRMAVLDFELKNPNFISPLEMIDSMNYRHGDIVGDGVSHGSILNKTQYIAENYREATDAMNSKSIKGIEDELFELRMKRYRLEYYISLLDKRDSDIIRMTYIDCKTRAEVANTFGVTTRTVQDMVKRAIMHLCDLYKYTVHLP